MMIPPLVNTLYNTSSYTVLLYIAVLDELTMCLYTQDSWTALHMAAQEGKVDLVRLLTEAQAQINIQTEVQYIHTCGIMYAYTVLVQCAYFSTGVVRHVGSTCRSHVLSLYMCIYTVLDHSRSIYRLYYSISHLQELLQLCHV